MPFHLQEDEIEDAEYTEAPAPVAQLKPDLAQDRARGVVDMRRVGTEADLAVGPSFELALYERRARAVTLFLKVPFFVFVALHDKTPGLIRLGAAALALWEASQIYRGQAELEQTTNEWVGQ